jgi:FlaA1/EpsC-like NDP-sugar epimerase
MLRYFLSLSRIKKQLIMVLIDSILLILAVFVSMSLRLGEIYIFSLSEQEKLIITWQFFVVPLVAIPIFFQFGVYRITIRFIVFDSLRSIIEAVTLYSLICGVLLYLFPIYSMPRSVILINWMLSIITIVGIRLIARQLLTRITENRDKRNVIIYGAGLAGRQLADALNQSIEYLPIGFIDDSSELNRQSINGLIVFSPNALKKLIQKHNVSQVLLAMPNLTRNRRNEIINFISSYSVLVRSLPAMSEITEGKVIIEDLREVNIKDLLGRSIVDSNKKLLKRKITNKIIMVTGAGGSIGSELCRHILLLKPKKLILFEMSESSLYQIEQELISLNHSNIEILPVIGSVVDEYRMKCILEYYNIQTLYHAAAYKHVPLVEYNQSQGVLNNSIGTMVAAQAAINAKVETFILISTDKAVRPTNIMGITKRIAELVVQSLSTTTSSTSFAMVRFGNVLDSSGSVIPMFKKQIKSGGPVTVTDPRIVRYFMTISEAVELVIQASAMSEEGNLFVLDMGEPILIVDLATKMIQLSGLQVADESNPDGDIEIKYIGLRPGEKLYEEILASKETIKTENPLIFKAEEEIIEWTLLKPILEELKISCIKTDLAEIRRILAKLVPEGKIQLPNADLLANNKEANKK